MRISEQVKPISNFKDNAERLFVAKFQLQIAYC